MVGIVLLGIFVLLLAFGAPIAVCLGMSSVGAILVQGAGKPLDAIMSVLPRLCSSASSKFVLLAIPFFILSGNVMEKAGISGRLINLAEKCLGHIRGGMAVIMPADYNAARKLVRQAAETYGPMYLRFTRDAVPQIYDEDVEFTIGKAHQIQDGKDVAIIANGDTVCLAIEAAKVLAGKGISARVLDMHTIKPLDVEAVTAAINDIGKVITVEDHNIINGLGSAVCEVAAEMGKGLVKRVGIRDQFGQSAPYERLLAMNGVTVEDIVAIAESMNA